MGWWKRKNVSEQAKETLLEVVKKTEDEAFQKCVKLTVASIVIGQPVEEIKKNMVQSLYQGNIDAGAGEEEALKNAEEKWGQIFAQAKEHLKAKGMNVK